MCIRDRENTESGIFGKAEARIVQNGQNPLPVAKNSEIKTGKATILANIAGEDVKEY